MEFPQRFGKYTLLKRIATGGMADIFLAHMKSNLGFEKEVVIKRLRAEHAANPDLVGMFLDEARTAANLTHPNIAQIFDLGEAEAGGYFIAMEYVRGVDLRHICAQGIEAGNYLPLHHAVRILASVCDALAYAHEECTAAGVQLKVVHRDVSPTNILVSYDGACKLIDFGIAKARTQATLTKVGQIKGKFGYMAPEQCRGEPVDARTDIFAVGINLYEITLGRRLFQGGTEIETLEAIENAVVPPPREVNPRYPEALERVVMRALAKDPADRYPDARQMQIALEEFLVSAGLRSTGGMLAAYMRRLFRDRIAEDNASLSKLRAMARSMPPSAAPPPSGDDDDATTRVSTRPDASDQTVKVQVGQLAEQQPVVQPPAAQQPVVQQPVAQQPAVQQPVVQQPVVQQPVVQQPVVQQPVVQQPVVQQPVVQQPPSVIVADHAHTPPSAADWPGGPSVVVDPGITAPGLRPAFAAGPAQARVEQMNPWSALNTVSARPPRRRSRLDLPADFAPPTEPNPDIMLDDDDLKIRKPRSYGGIIMLLLIAGGGFALYTVMMQDAQSDRVRGNPNMQIAPPKLDTTTASKGPERPPPAKAMLRLTSTPPGARVSVNGNMVGGVTPTAVQVFQGASATVTMMLEGHKPATKRLAVTGASAEAALTLEAGDAPTGALDVRTEPGGADVWLDGQPVGKTPLQLDKVAAGTVRTLRFQLAGRYDHTVLYHLEPEKTGRIFVRLPTAIGERTMAAVQVETRPVGAEVGRITEKGIKPAGTTTGQIGVKINAPIDEPLSLQATKAKHAPASVDLDVQDPFYTVYLRLKPPVVHYGAFSLSGSRGLTVYVGSEELGKSPIRNEKLKAGTHKLTVVDEESGTRHVSQIVIDKDQTLGLKVAFKDGKIRIE